MCAEEARQFSTHRSHIAAGFFFFSTAETRGLRAEPHQEVVGTVSPAFFSFFLGICAH